MPKIAVDSQPKYRKHKATGQAIVTFSGRDHYLGPHGSAASRREYDRLITEWIANGRTVPSPKADLAIVELIAAYVRHTTAYYRGSSECEATAYSLRPLKELYGRLSVAEFGPLKLKAVRQKMIDADLCRNEINKRVGRIKRMFRWGVENELVPSSILEALRAVVGLAGGRSEARETDRVGSTIVALRATCSLTIWL